MVRWTVATLDVAMKRPSKRPEPLGNHRQHSDDDHHLSLEVTWDRGPVTSGGREMVWVPWKLDASLLRPTEFSYTVGILETRPNQQDYQIKPFSKANRIHE